MKKMIIIMRLLIVTVSLSISAGIVSIESTGSDAVFYSFSTMFDQTVDMLSTEYENPFLITNDETINAIAYKSGYLPSDAVSASKKVIINSTVPNELNKDNSLLLYPVPASTYISIEAGNNYLGNVTIRVHNPLGQSVYFGFEK